MHAVYAEDLSLIPRIHIKTGHSVACQRWKGRKKGDPGAPWPASLAESMSSRFRERPCLKKEGVEEDTWHKPFAPHAHEQTEHTTHIPKKHLNNVVPTSLWKKKNKAVRLNTKQFSDLIRHSKAITTGIIVSTNQRLILSPPGEKNYQVNMWNSQCLNFSSVTSSQSKTGTFLY